MNNAISAGRLIQEGATESGPAGIDIARMRAYRYARLQQQLRDHDCVAALLNDPLNFAPGMTICVESYIGEVGGPDGIKMEQQVLITETGHEILSQFPLESKLC